MTRILLVEDDPSLGATLKERLGKEGYDVAWASTKADAAREAGAGAFDLYIFDVGLPDGTGFELARELPPKPFLFLTAQGDAESRLQGYELGAEEYIPKPFHLRELLLRVKHVLENHAPSSALKIGGVEANFESFTFTRDGDSEQRSFIFENAGRGEPEGGQPRRCFERASRRRQIPLESHRRQRCPPIKNRSRRERFPVHRVRARSRLPLEPRQLGETRMNTRFQNALNGVAQNTPPIWFMRQAGRYHKHYQALRKSHSFMELCKRPELAAEVALGPVAEFDFDVSILFSDLLFPLEALGLGLSYDPAPKLEWHLTEGNLQKLRPFRSAVTDLEFQKDALMATRKVLPKDKSLIGFVGGPWTLFTYAVEGEHKGSLTRAKSGLSLYHNFSEFLLPLLEANIQLQLDGGAEVVMMFDTAAGELSPAVFHDHLEPHILAFARKFPGKIGYYSKGTTPWHIQSLREKPVFAGFGVDHRFEIADVLKETKHGFLQGNFDQGLLFCDGEEFESRLMRYLEPIQRLTPSQRRYWVCGLGHGVLPQTPEENVKNFVKRVREVFA